MNGVTSEGQQNIYFLLLYCEHLFFIGILVASSAELMCINATDFRSDYIWILRALFAAVYWGLIGERRKKIIEYNFKKNGDFICFYIVCVLGRIATKVSPSFLGTNPSIFGTKNAPYSFWQIWIDCFCSHPV